jgi:acetolactate synthase-1/2/3 large subunit
MVCITGQVGKHLLGSDAFQETDIIGISTPVTKWNYQITEASEIPEIMAKLLHCTIRTSRALLVDITKMRLMNLSSVIKCTNIRSYNPKPTLNIEK